MAYIPYPLPAPFGHLNLIVTTSSFQLCKVLSHWLATVGECKLRAQSFTFGSKLSRWHTINLYGQFNSFLSILRVISGTQIQLNNIQMMNNDLWCPRLPGGALPIPGILRVCHLEGWVRENFALQKGPLLTFCLTKGCLFGPRNALQQGPFLPKSKVSPLKNACFANVKLKVHWIICFEAISGQVFPNLPFYWTKEWQSNPTKFQSILLNFGKMPKCDVATNNINIPCT